MPACCAVVSVQDHRRRPSDSSALKRYRNPLIVVDLRSHAVNILRPLSFDFYEKEEALLLRLSGNGDKEEMSL
ncbi:hypothetical protein L1987_45117 [Smallanthus sonchifolius]|uniref:Uncharacterized protein n=1 Tax=Smallanthus sonchifolius TaxID=185202 RepID=A0ACB9GS05_9ASTR|nr:hypothetical protein L1987_45117 [Smallanthus sonchifolius]